MRSHFTSNRFNYSYPTNKDLGEKAKNNPNALLQQGLCGVTYSETNGFNFQFKNGGNTSANSAILQEQVFEFDFKQPRIGRVDLEYDTNFLLGMTFINRDGLKMCRVGATGRDPEGNALEAKDPEGKESEGKEPEGRDPLTKSIVIQHNETIVGIRGQLIAEKRLSRNSIFGQPIFNAEERKFFSDFQLCVACKMETEAE